MSWSRIPENIPYPANLPAFDKGMCQLVKTTARNQMESSAWARWFVTLFAGRFS